MEFLKWECKVDNVNKNLRIHCPKCRSRFFWDRSAKFQFDKTGYLNILCVRCNQLYWAVKSRDNFHVYVKTNREDEEDY